MSNCDTTIVGYTFDHAAHDIRNIIRPSWYHTMTHELPSDHATATIVPVTFGLSSYHVGYRVQQLSCQVRSDHVTIVTYVRTFPFSKGSSIAQDRRIFQTGLGTGRERVDPERC